MTDYQIEVGIYIMANTIGVSIFVGVLIGILKHMLDTIFN